jgi:ubiquinone/menaquinone biosynthesis C-methylase UbiE
MEPFSRRALRALLYVGGGVAITAGLDTVIRGARSLPRQKRANPSVEDGAEMPEGDTGPDQGAALAQYREAAPGYDRHMRRFARWQRMAVERLELRAGETVIDVGCGTGIVVPLLQAAVGPTGRIVGIELSPEMASQARERVAQQDWENVSVIEAAVESATIDGVADAALFSLTHDVLQSSTAVANVVAYLKPGARVSSVGAKLAGGWSPIMNFFVRRSARPYVTTFRGLERPWREREPYVHEFHVKSLALGGAYVASARLTEDGPASAAEKIGSSVR